MIVPAMKVFLMREVFFITAQQVKTSGEQVEVQIPGGVEERLVIIQLETIDPLRMYALFEEQCNRLDQEFIFN
jgi:hypothetical protein